ncbi:NFX1-type zinc finger-containing protein 1-like isoform X2 [Dendronephthya gigantea]|nr:NFX1-type zinc finger-containing protein 1-like isoform X2 [Dendronephthya gigantea]
MPLADELVFGRKSSPPEYTMSCDPKKECDWSTIFEKPSNDGFSFPEENQLNPFEQFKYLEAESTKRLLDESQMKGIENFLQHRVSLIQGPPGTGKSFLGVKILRLMLSLGVHQRYGGPILVMTYKNLALDHFLMASLEYTTKMVRIGRTNENGNEKLEGINLRNVRKGIDRKLQQNDQKVQEMKRKSQFKLRILFKCLSNPIFSIRSFFQAASRNNITSLLNPDEINVNQREIDDLLSKWKPNTAPNERLKALVRKSLKIWLPRDKIQERFKNHTKVVPESHQFHVKNSVSSSPTKDDSDLHYAIDSKVAAQEREQNALEGDCPKDDYEIPNKTEDCGDDGDLIPDVYIPFVWENYEDEEEDVYEYLNLWELDDDERVNFICFLQREIVREFGKAVRSYEDNAKLHQDYLDDSTVNTLKEYDVIGMTVTGAALRLHLLDQLKPCAVIVEEAAEIIEGQLLAVLPPTIQHLVMLGDQKQLKPRLNCYQLKKRNLDCSMFERLINYKLDYQMLDKQCRMRDDIADLLRSLNIYKDLKTNEKKTSGNNPPDCVGHSLLFVKHQSTEKRMKGSNSLWNPQEISMVLEVAEYLMKNNYNPYHVTVLCAYSGQVEKMKAAFKRKSLDTSQEYYPKLRDISITTVDSFQGNENKVILLSLVRSNKEDKIGFLNEQNRICVAISRAQCALYMFGNASTYRSTSRNWKIIIKFLEDRRLIVNMFPFEDAINDGNRTVEDKRSIFGMKLNRREITRLSKGIVMRWEELSALENIPRGDFENLFKDNVNYPEPRKKAEKCLVMINEKSDFSREILACHLEELNLHELAGFVRSGELRDAVLN